MAIVQTVSLRFDGKNQHLENALRQTQGIANLWTITLWMKPFETTSRFDSENRPLFRPDGKAILHIKGKNHRNEILIWGERIDNSLSEEFIVIENWNENGSRIRATRFNLAQKRQEWRNFSCSWNGDNLIAWNNGIELTDTSEVVSGTDSFVMDDPSISGGIRSIRIGAAYSGTGPGFGTPGVITYSGLMGPIGVWDEVLSPLELGAIASGTFAYDLTTNSGTYTSSANLQHWWRLGADVDDVGNDYSSLGDINVGDDATISGTNVAADWV